MGADHDAGSEDTVNGQSQRLLSPGLIAVWIGILVLNLAIWAGLIYFAVWCVHRFFG